MQATDDWQATVLAMKADGKTAGVIAEVVGKHVATVRKVINRAAPVTNGNGHGVVDAETAERLRAAAESPIPGQTTVEDMIPPGDLPEPDGHDEPAETVYVEEIRVDGTTQLGMFSSGGKAAGSASLRLSGGRIMLLDGRAFRKGDTIRFSGTAVIREVAQRDTPDRATGIVVSAEQKHVAQITDLRVT